MYWVGACHGLPKSWFTVGKILITILVVSVGALIHLHDPKLNQCFGNTLNVG